MQKTSCERYEAVWRLSGLKCVLLYLLTVEHFLHHAFMFGWVVAVVGGCERPVTAESRVEEEELSSQPKQSPENTIKIKEWQAYIFYNTYTTFNYLKTI